MGRVTVPMPQTRRVHVLPYDPAWRLEFQSVRSALRLVLGRAATAIHHIGSTSVPGLCAKPVIDVLVEVLDLGALDEAAPGLETIGYEARGEHGIPGRRYFSRPAGEGPTVHVHAFPSGSEDVVRHLRFRDHLRSHPEDAAAYGLLKRELARRFSRDRNAYQARKAGFIGDVVARAANGAAERAS
jgi:GrpB-like predicted nucleotidyltransferase (UPF0157 family)